MYYPPTFSESTEIKILIKASCIESFFKPCRKTAVRYQVIYFLRKCHFPLHTKFTWESGGEFRAASDTYRRGIIKGLLIKIFESISRNQKIYQLKPIQKQMHGTRSRYKFATSFRSTMGTMQFKTLYKVFDVRNSLCASTTHQLF